MNATNHGHGSSTPTGNAGDVSKRANLIIWTYFFAFGIGLYVMISAVNLYFRYGTEREIYLKVGSVVSKELTDQKAEDAAILSGKLSFYEGKRNVSIDDAINQMIKVTQ